MHTLYTGSCTMHYTMGSMYDHCTTPVINTLQCKHTVGALGCARLWRSSALYRVPTPATPGVADAFTQCADMYGTLCMYMCTRTVPAHGECAWALGRQDGEGEERRLQCRESRAWEGKRKRRQRGERDTTRERRTRSQGCVGKGQPR